MHLTRLTLTNIRSYSQAELTPNSRMNIIYGTNGSGKTSLLEAIYLVGMARSFRTQAVRDIIRKGADRLLVVGAVNQQEGMSLYVGVEKDREQTRIRVNARELNSSAELASQIPTLLLTPDTHNEFFCAPKTRRRLIDMTLFHVKPSYFREWKDYYRTLKHRNHLLRLRATDKEISVWDKGLIQAAEKLHRARTECVQAMEGLAQKLLVRSFTDVSLEYLGGWERGQTYQAILVDKLAGDRDMGYTRYGPHRADICLKLAQQQAEPRLSRGQQKLMIYAIQLACASLIERHTRKPPIILVDDVFADLDRQARGQLMEMLHQTESQKFLTCVELETLPSNTCPLAGGPQNVAVFHVEQGKIHHQAPTYLTAIPVTAEAA